MIRGVARLFKMGGGSKGGSGRLGGWPGHWHCSIDPCTKCHFMGGPHLRGAGLLTGGLKNQVPLAAPLNLINLLFNKITKISDSWHFCHQFTCSWVFMHTSWCKIHLKNLCSLKVCIDCLHLIGTSECTMDNDKEELPFGKGDNRFQGLDFGKTMPLCRHRGIVLFIWNVSCYTKNMWTVLALTTNGVVYKLKNSIRTTSGVKVRAWHLQTDFLFPAHQSEKGKKKQTNKQTKAKKKKKPYTRTYQIHTIRPIQTPSPL